MKKIIIISSILLLVGCSTQNVSTNSAPLHISLSQNVGADIDVGRKISGEASASLLFGILQLPGGPNKFADGVFESNLSMNPFDPTAKLKAAASYNAISSGHADIIVNPQYFIKITNFLLIKHYTVEVTGYRGTVTKFH